MSSNGSLTTVPDTSKPEEFRSPAGTVPSSAGYGDVSHEPELHESPMSERHEFTESEAQNAMQVHLPKDEDSHDDNLVEPDGYQSMTLDVSIHNIWQMMVFSNLPMG